MKKIISFSLWGDNPKYTLGAIKNANLSREIYPGWICRFYVGESVPEDILKELESIDNVEIVKMGEMGEWNSMFWRFYPISDEDTEIMISRDCDSRLSMREKYCVDEFINSDKLFHTMVDHPWHGGIMGGMWGAKKGILKEMKNLIDEWPKTNQWQTDQSFLNHVISPLVSNIIMIHDSINLKNFPTKRENYHFVGEVFDGNDNRYEHFGILGLPEYEGL
jgi:protein O-GlcNAc transferase